MKNTSMALRIAFAFWLAIFSAGAVLAQDQVRITADTFVVEEDSTVATFTGNVVVTQTDLTVNADKVVVRYGEGGTSDIKSLEASGALVITTPEQKVTGNKGIYDPRTRIMIVTGNVKVVSASGTVTGPSLEVNFDTRTTRFTGQGNGRVTGVFNP